jgi:hypothetical protein
MLEYFIFDISFLIFCGIDFFVNELKKRGDIH